MQAFILTIFLFFNIGAFAANDSKVNPLKNNLPPVNISKETCLLQQFTQISREQLTEVINTVSLDCMRYWLFQPLPLSYREPTFTEQNMLHIAHLAIEQASGYNKETDMSGFIHKLYVFLRAGLWNYANYSSRFTEINKEAIHQKLIQSLSAFVENEHFYKEGNHHAGVLEEFVQLINTADLEYLYLSQLTELLRRRHITRSHISSEKERNLVSALFTLINESEHDIYVMDHQDDYTHIFESNMANLTEVLVDIAISDHLLWTPSANFLDQSLDALQFILHYYNESLPIVSTAKEGIKKVINHYESFQNSFFSDRYYEAIGALVYWYDRNDIYLSDLVEEVLKKVFPFKYSCGRYIIRSQLADRNHREEVCNQLINQEEVFHSIMDTKEEPVPDDFNDSVEVIIYANYSNYVRQSYHIFGNFTNNGGIYFESSPSKPYNIPRIFMFVKREDPFYNLKHEHIHYLNGRYSMYGPYRDYNTSTHKTMFWIEGLAEYISNGNNSPEAIDIARSSGGLNLGAILSYQENQFVRDRLYHLSYLAVRFMFEKHPEDITEILDFFYKGDYDGYLRYINSIATTYAGEFSSWLNTVTVNNNPLPRISRKQ